MRFRLLCCIKVFVEGVSLCNSVVSFSDCFLLIIEWFVLLFVGFLASKNTVYSSRLISISIIYLPSGTRGVVAQSPEPGAHDKSD